MGKLLWEIRVWQEAEAEMVKFKLYNVNEDEIVAAIACLIEAERIPLSRVIYATSLVRGKNFVDLPTED